MPTLIFEDVKHKFMWNTIVNIFEYVRENNIEEDFVYEVEYGKTIIKINIHANFDVSDIKKILLKYVLDPNDFIIINDCYLCKYDFKLVDTDDPCKNCPAKIVQNYTLSSRCLEGYFDKVSTIKIVDIPFVPQLVFDDIIKYCTLIRDLEFKDNVLLRSELTE